MFLAVPAAITAAGAAYAYARPSADTSAAEAEAKDDGEANNDAEPAEEAAVAADDESEKPKPRTWRESTWRESAGRSSGGEGYCFGDLTRGVVVRMWGGSKPTEEEAAIEAAGDEQYTHVQMLVRDAVRIFRARGYTGTINMSHTVAHFTESCMLRVEGPKDGVAPWESATAGCDAASRADSAMDEHGRSGAVFNTLLMRLERRARSWHVMSGDEGLDPSLTSSAHVGFALPVIKIGWGVSVSLTVTTSSLLRYAKYAGTLELNQLSAAEARPEHGAEHELTLDE